MKKSVLCLLAAIGAMVACSREGIDAPESNAVTVNVRAGLAGAPKTKTAIIPGENNQFSFTWKAGDKLAVIEAVPHIQDLIDGDPEENYPYPAELYSSQALTADATEAVFTLDLPERDYVSGDLHYLAIYPATCAVDVPAGYWDADNDRLYAVIDFPREQHPLADSFDPDADVLVSKAVTCHNVRPTELDFNFARVGTIVKMVLTGLPEGTVITGGSIELGFESGYYFEYDPAQERIITSDGTDGIVFSYDPGLVVGAGRTATVWLRSMSGVSGMIDLWLYTDSTEYHRRISLRARGTTLEFKEGGLTTFSVRMGAPDVDNPDEEDIDYHTNADLDGVTFTWPYSANPKLDGYECFLFDENGVRHDFDSAAQDGSNFVATVNSGLSPGEYTLYVRALATAGYESQHDYLEVYDIKIGVPIAAVISYMNCHSNLSGDLDSSLSIPGHEDDDTRDLYRGLYYYHRNMDWSSFKLYGDGTRTKSWAFWNETPVRFCRITVTPASGSTAFSVYSSDTFFTGGEPGSNTALTGTSDGAGGYVFQTGNKNYFLITSHSNLSIDRFTLEYYK